MRNEVIIQKLIGYAEKIVGYCATYTQPESFLSNTILVKKELYLASPT